MRHKHLFNFILFAGLVLSYTNCTISKKAKHKPYSYGSIPSSYQDVVKDYENYYIHLGCRPGETIASIGAGNGVKEVQVSCIVDGINWYLEEIDSARLHEFTNVLAYHENIKGTPVNAKFQLVLGEENSTTLPHGIFDRVLMINVFHEIENRKPILMEIHNLLKPGGELVMMERMGDKPGQMHGDCNHPKLYEPELEAEMLANDFYIANVVMAEEMSRLTFYSFKARLK